MFSRLGAWCVRRKGTVVIAWVLVLVIGGSLSGAIGSNFSTEFGLPDVESKRGFDILDAEMGGAGTGLEGTIVFQSADGFDDPDLRAEIDEFLTTVPDAAPDEVDPADVTVTSPFVEEQTDPNSPMVQWLIAGTDDPAALAESFGSGNPRISEDGTVAFAEVSVPGDTDVEAATLWGTEVKDAAPSLQGVQIEYGGDIFQEFAAPSSEILGLAFAIVILILAFGSVLAMGLPIGVALAGIGVGSISLMLLSNLFVMPDFATILGVMIGLGVGIDYALFIVTRFREQLHAGHTVQESVAIAIDTSGRAVTFAGLTVVISLLGMLLMNVSFVSGLGIGAAVVVAITVIASLTLLPALLGYVGERVEVTRWRGVVAAMFVSLALVGAGLHVSPLMVGFPLAVIVLIAGSFRFSGPLNRKVARRPPKPLRDTTAYKWSRFVQARPWPLAIGATLLLVVLAIPVFGIRLGFSDAGNLAEDNTGRKAYDMISEGFGPGSNGRLLLVAEVPEGMDASSSAPFLAVSDAVAAQPGVASVSPPVPSNMEDPAASNAVIWTVVPTTSPQDEATTDLVLDLRDRVLPEATADSGLQVLVTGQVGIMVDFSDYLAGRLPYFFAAVLGLSFLLLMAVFRSLLVPLKAVVMNLLSIGAAYGVIVAIFQWGWMKDVFGIEPAPIEPFMPMMLFAIVFGLSMDYEVFLLSRVREEWQRTGDPRTSVADGLAATARVITAAAAIMIFVFGSFLLEGERIIKLMGFGLAFAVLLDATVVRMLLVPATMELLGAKNWWIPRWLDRILPNINVEGPSHLDEISDDGDPDEAPPRVEEPAGV
jgi:RND superfamily putative drug exporter